MSMIRLLSIAAVTLLLAFQIDAAAADRKVIVGFRHSPEAHEYNLLHGARGTIRRTHRHIQAIAAEIPEEEIARLKQDASVDYIVGDIRVQPVQPALSLTLTPSEYGESWGVSRIGAEAAASRGFKGAGVKVAIIDSGIDYNHPDLKDNYRGGFNFINNTPDPYDEDTISHGTHVAGIIAAKDNGTGVVGVAPAASLYAVKVFGAQGAGGDLSTIISAIEWAIDNEMNVVNLSVGIDSAMADLLPEVFRPLKDVCDLAYSKGIILVAAAGNDGRERIAIPAAYGSVLAVSATDRDNLLATFNPNMSSNYGADIELAAPGKEIKSTVRGGGYAVLSGTSQAAPHVTGAAAILLSAGLIDTSGNGNLADEARQRLFSTATDLGVSGRDIRFGWGLVDLAAATAIPATRLLHLVSSPGKPGNDAVKVTLPKGNYRISATATDMHKIIIRESGASKHHGVKTEHVLHLTGNHPDSELEYDLGHSGATLEFIPYGKPGASADILISKIIWKEKS